MSGFPLYDNLIKDLPKKDLSVKEKEQFIINIDNVDLNGQQLMYALVVVFYQHDISKSEDAIPYSGSKEEIKKGVYNFCWVFTKFPIKLRHLLVKFVEMHLDQQKREEKRVIQSS
uniref:Uncharacterized protein n=1 Tax=viral metagenome TaxID=1070528 RepID=A0A6C0LY39_9ZZZZ